MARRRGSVFEYNEQFHLLDLNQDGHLDKHELMHAFNACGRCITEKELEVLMKDAGCSGPDFSESDFTRMMQYQKKKLPEKSQIIAAFECLDPQGDGFVSAQQLKKCLMNRGDEKYSEKEANALIADAGAIDGQIEYKLFIDFMMAHTISADDPFS